MLQYNQDFPEGLYHDNVEMLQEDQQFMNCLRNSAYHTDCHWTTEEEGCCHSAQQPQCCSTELSNRKGNSKQILSSIKSTVTS